MNIKTHPSLLSDILISNFGDIVNDIFTEDQKTSRPTFRPNIEFIEKEKSFLLSVALPGMAKENISIKLEGDILKITGENKSPKKEGTAIVSEIRYGKYTRSLKLPQNVNTLSTDANYTDGVLYITLDKKEKDQPKEISIS